MILEDFPNIAPQSVGDLFDATEIDELLSLRVRALTDDEKREAASLDPRIAALLRRAESMSEEQSLGLHGVWRTRDRRESFAPGDRVRLCPSRRADAMDLMLTGRIATIVSVEHDLEDQCHLVVTIDDDPGRDLGLAGKVGHRFFYRPDEVERLQQESS